MRPPFRFAWRNLLFGDGVDDVWALFRLDLTSYEGLTAREARELLGDLAGFAYEIEADFTLRRVTRGWSPDEHRFYAGRGFDPRTGHRERFDGLLAAQQRALEERGVWRPEVYLEVRLAEPARAAFDDAAQTLGSWLSNPRGRLRALARSAGLGDPAAIGEARLRELAALEASAYDRVAARLACERATTLDLQWLVRRAFCRGTREPQLDVHWRPPGACGQRR